MDQVRCVTGVLSQLVTFLDDEVYDVEDGKPGLLTPKAVRFIKERADQCLVLFWRIEHALGKRNETRGFEERLIDQLHDFNEELKENKLGRVPRLDSMQVLMNLESRKSVEVEPKLDRYSKQLKKLQLNLLLVFQVVSIQARSASW